MRIQQNIAIAGLALALFSLAGCEVGEDVGPRNSIDAVSVSHALVQMGSCDDYLAYAKKTARQRMRAMVERSCQEMLRYADEMGHDQAGGVLRTYSSDGDVGDAAPEAAMDNSASGEEGSADFSQTNNQEEGVDEADMVKTDGDYIYTISGRDLVIVSIDDTGTLAEVGRITLTGRPEELFLYGDRAVVFSSLAQADVPESLVLPSPPTVDYGDDKDIAVPEPAMDMESPDMYYEGAYTGIDVIDLSDRTAPVLVRNAQYAGHYVSSRRIDGAVRAVISSPLPALEFPTWVNVDYWDMSENQAKRAINQACDEVLQANIEAINALTIDDIVPRKYDSTSDTDLPIAECTDIYGPETPAGSGLLTVVSLDMEKPTEMQQDVAVVGQEGHVYASQSALYLTTASDYVLVAWESGLWDDETSGIHKFDIASSAATATYLGSGEAPGRLLNQFSLGEYEDHLRVATTTGSAWWEDNTLDNHIVIFKEQGGKLAVTGELSGIGTGEEIYAARFIGPRGFVVTYLQTDPLFTFDLSDPTNPKVVGEWLGPGYSTYLHPYGENLLIAMGMDQNWTVGISLYDLSNFAEPTLVERQQLPMVNYQTAALYEHKAFTFNPATGELLLPFHDYDAANGVLKYLVTDTEIDLQGILDMSESVSLEGPTRRAMYNGDAMIGVSACRLTSALISDPTQVINTIPIWDDACEFPYWYYY